MAAVISLQDTFPCSLGFPGKLPRQRCPGPAAPGRFLNSAALVRFQEKKKNNNKKMLFSGAPLPGLTRGSPEWFPTSDHAVPNTEPFS